MTDLAALQLVYETGVRDDPGGEMLSVVKALRCALKMLDDADDALDRLEQISALAGGCCQVQNAHDIKKHFGLVDTAGGILLEDVKAKRS